MKLVPVKWGAPMPRLGDTHVDDVVSLTQLKFQIHDLNNVIMVPLAKSFQNESAEITAVPNLVASLVKIFAIDIEDVLIERIRRVVMLDRKSRKLVELGGQS
jgi:hypothetical protein